MLSTRQTWNRILNRVAGRRSGVRPAAPASYSGSCRRRRPVAHAGAAADALEQRVMLSYEAIAFVDPAVWGENDVPAAVRGAVNEVVVLDASTDGVEQIAAFLDGRTGVDAVHVISHGGEGSVGPLGLAVLDSSTVDSYSAEFAAIGEALAVDGDVLLWGCNVAGNGSGLIEAIAAATGGDVAASDDLTGSPSLGGDWDLEVATGPIEAADILGPADPAVILESDTLSGAQTISSSSGTINAGIQTGDDVDVWRINLSKGETVTIDVRGSASGISGGMRDPYLRVFNSSGGEVARNDDGGTGLDSRLSWNVPSNGAYYFGVSAYPNFSYNPVNDTNTSSGSTGNYRLTWSVQDRPQVRVGNASVGEGGTARFAVTLSRGTGVSTSVRYETRALSASAGSDFNSTSGTLNFSPGQTVAYVNVSTRQDRLDEPNETFDVRLSSASGLSIADALGRGTILDDDSTPRAVAGGPYSILEGQPLTLSAAGSSDADGDVLSFQWDLDNNGTFDVSGATPTVSPSQLSAYGLDDDGTYSVRLRASDGFNSGLANATVSVGNARPLLRPIADVTIDESGTAVVSGSFTDAGPADTHSVVIDWGDGTTTNAAVNQAARTFTASRRFDDDAVLNVVATVSDDDGGSASAAATLTVQNLAPVVTSVTGSTVDEGGTATVAGSFTDAGTLDTHTVDVDWGDGVVTQATVDQTAGTFTASRSFADDANLTATATVTDDDGGSGSAQAAVVVENVDPVLAGVTVTPVIDENGVVTFTGSFSDAGTADTHTLLVDWGDGSPQEAFTYGPGTTSFSETHRYLDDGPSPGNGTAADAYTVRVVGLADDDGGSAELRDAVTASPALNGDITDGDFNNAASASFAPVLSDGFTFDTFGYAHAHGGTVFVAVDVRDATSGAWSQVFGQSISNLSFGGLSVSYSPREVDAYRLRSTPGQNQTFHRWSGGATINFNGNASADATVRNVAPVLSNVSLTPRIDEDGVATLSADVADVGTRDVLTVDVNWGDGSSVETIDVTGRSDFTLTHQYLEDATYPVSVTLRDDDTGVAAEALRVEVDNVAPTLANLSVTSPVEENAVATLAGEVVDPGTLDDFTVTVDWGDGTAPVEIPLAAGQTAFTLDHVYPDDGVSGTAFDDYTVTVSVADDDMAGGTDVASLLADLNAANTGGNTAIRSANPIPYDFSDGQTGFRISDGGGDMYDGGNRLNTDRATDIPYTNGVVTDGSNYFGTGSEYFTVKYQGVFALAATGVSVSSFYTTGNNGADGSGTADAAVIPTSVGGRDFTVFAKRVYNAFDPSINQLVIVPGDGSGVSQTFANNTDDGRHDVNGLAGTGEVYYVLVAGANGGFLNDAALRNVADAFLASVASAAGTGQTPFSTTLTARVNNVAPVVASITGSAINENGVATVTGSFTDAGSLDTHTVTIDWGDGTTSAATVDAATRTFTASKQYLDDGPTGTPSDDYAVTATVTDDDTGSDVATTTVTVNNVAPTIDGLTTGSADIKAAAADGLVTLSGLFSDVGTLDTHTAVVDWGDGTPAEAVAVDQLADTLSASHQYAAGGVFTVTLTLTDDDGGTDTATTVAFTEGVGLVDGTLYVIGTDGRDHVNLSAKKGALTVDAKLDQGPGQRKIKQSFDLDDVDNVVALLRGGDDHWNGHLGRDVLVPQAVLGGDGDDHIKGGEAGDLLVGGEGRDKIFGRGGDDLLVANIAEAECDPALLDGVIGALGGSAADMLAALGDVTEDGDRDDLKGEGGTDLLLATGPDKTKQ